MSNLKPLPLLVLLVAVSAVPNNHVEGADASGLSRAADGSRRGSLRHAREVPQPKGMHSSTGGARHSKDTVAGIAPSGAAELRFSKYFTLQLDDEYDIQNNQKKYSPARFQNPKEINAEDCRILFEERQVWKYSR